ncbi:M28 family metallopeptidase [Acidomonas methanolica]|uniref:Peptidase n=2 Tax=Acidomonas methanolica TaxID=437 RepID=A0A023D9F1_ACIMT|nr:M28 family metallopeptidase [Acidomonas methanolica]MBU2652916.1 M20/M25/M40 family metallo-hydrolase [Acidomonas methanolica]GAJ30441.1 peptidase [Acidomonas methanolica NBRC 104435]GEK98432.1 peptidase [Acidomonas methanolica NBRC 104435]
MKRSPAFSPAFLMPALLAFAGCAATPASHPADPASPRSYAPISPERMSEDIRTLASDPFQGRAPGTEGEKVTVAWLIEQFKALGLEPGGENGGWTQDVPMIRTRPSVDGAVTARTGGRTMRLVQLRDICLSTLLPERRIRVTDAPMVFVGYGVSAPERGWDDFKGVDLRGKVAIFLVNDPDFDAKPGEAVAGKFGGRAMTYYGRWTYKFEEAARRGAVAALVVHDTPGASYPWSTVVAPGGVAYDIARDGNGAKPVPVQGWLEGGAAARLFAQAGLDLAALREKARAPDFRPVALRGTRLSVDMPVTLDRLVSRNVLAKITGARFPEESVMFGAHWDAFGESKGPDGGTVIRRGAVDDGSGIAAVLEIARALRAGPTPDRTVRFAAWTGEERGLLGSSWYVAHPLAPLEKTAANLTMDVLQMGGAARNAYVVGAGQDSLQQDFARAAAAQGRTTRPEAMPERGAFYRADHLPFARAGVPVLAVMDMAGAFDLVNGGEAAGARWLKDYMACYHQPCDAWHADWDLRGAAQDAAAVLAVGRGVAFSHDWPYWEADSEFRAVRENSAAARAPL